MAESKIDSILSAMEQANLPSDAAMLRRALHDREKFPHRRLADIMCQTYWPVTEASVRRWRRANGV